MAKLMVIGKAADVEIIRDPLDREVAARCVRHNEQTIGMPIVCGWTASYDDLGDATEYAGDHADGAR